MHATHERMTRTSSRLTGPRGSRSSSTPRTRRSARTSHRLASTLDPEPGPRVPVVAETLESPSPRVDETLDMPSPGEGATLDMPVSGGSKEPHGGRRTEVGTRVMTAVADSADDATDDDPMAEVGRRPAGATIRPSRPIGGDVPGYEILAEIGRGGMGVVYKARHIRLDRLVALKMILAGAHASDDQIARFHIEAQAVAQIQHPGIVQIYEVGDHRRPAVLLPGIRPGGSLAQLDRRQAAAAARGGDDGDGPVPAPWPRPTAAGSSTAT